MTSVSIKLSSVEITEFSISEFEGKQLMLSLPRDHISSISLQRGISAERPIVEVAIGILFILAGFYIFWSFFWSIWKSILLEPGSTPSPNTAAAKFSILGLLFVPVGVLMLKKALKRRFFLSVETKNKGCRKVIFDDDLAYYEIRSFLENAIKTYGYPIKLKNPE